VAPSRSDASIAAAALAAQIRAESARFGFDAVGFARAEEHPHASRLREWIAEGRHGGMLWMARDPARRADPRRLIREARTVISVAASYYRGDWPAEDGVLRGRVARYAWGRDYHGRLLRRLRALGRAVSRLAPGGNWTACMDARPALDRGWAERAGLGWIGKNTNVILEKRGSWFVLGEIVTTLDLPASAPARNHCGRCTACIPACPTGAIVAPYVLDARRCISYLTIEHHGPIPIELRPLVGARIFGCDDCQEVCPWNRHATPSVNPDLEERPDQQAPKLIPLLALDGSAFRARFTGTPLLRAGRDGFVRNVAVALGNLRDRRAVAALRRAAGADPSPVVREHAAWALERIGAPDPGDEPRGPGYS
jgi:epoxyqueuosine reductase